MKTLNKGDIKLKQEKKKKEKKEKKYKNIRVETPCT